MYERSMNRKCMCTCLKKDVEEYEPKATLGLIYSKAVKATIKEI